MVLNADRVINGSYGSLFDGDELLAQVRSVAARIAINRQDIMPVGDSWTRYKKTNYTGDGSFTLWKATSAYLNKMDIAINGIIDDDDNPGNTVPQLVLLVKLDDPESLGAEKIQLKKVKIWEVPIGFETGEIVEETIQFTFEGFDLVQAISGNVSSA